LILTFDQNFIKKAMDKGTVTRTNTLINLLDPSKFTLISVFPHFKGDSCGVFTCFITPKFHIRKN